MNVYCPHCWASVSEKDAVCPSCQRALDDEQATLVDKCIAALRHPQAETRLRVAWMLGQMRAKEALAALVEVIERRGDGDPYLLGMAAWSLGQIGDAEAGPTLEALANDANASFMARREAEKALALLSKVG